MKPWGIICIGAGLFLFADLIISEQKTTLRLIVGLLGSGLLVAAGTVILVIAEMK